MNYSLVVCDPQQHSSIHSSGYPKHKRTHPPIPENDVMWCRIIQVPWLLPSPGYCTNWPCPDTNQDRLAMPPSRRHGSRHHSHLERRLADAQQLKQPVWNSSATRGALIGYPCAAPNHIGVPAETRVTASDQAWPCPAPSVPVPAGDSPRSLCSGAFSAARFGILSQIAWGVMIFNHNQPKPLSDYFICLPAAPQ